MPTRPSFDDAVKYVADIETRWFGSAQPLLAVAPMDMDGTPMVRIITCGPSGNDWAVWTESNGTIYGEC